MGVLACETEFSTLLVEIFIGRDDVDIFNRNELRTRSSMRLIGSSSLSPEQKGKMEMRKIGLLARRKERRCLLSRYPISKVEFLAGLLGISGNPAYS